MEQAIYNYGKNTSVDFGKAAKEYSMYRHGFPQKFFDIIENEYFFESSENIRILDIGTGTGTISRYYANKGYNVTAVDLSSDMLRECKIIEEREKSENHKKITYINCPAEDIDFEPNSFDYIFAGQCWHWLKSNQMLDIIQSILAENGRLIICHLDYMTHKDSIAKNCNDIIKKFNPDFPFDNSGLYPQWTIDILDNGNYANIETRSFDVECKYTKLAWIMRLKACSGAVVLNNEQMIELEKELTICVDEISQEDVLSILHRVWWVTASLKDGNNNNSNE
eukprot:TRINITY_DN14545_c0_g1_i1.p1 TRINITY_DN14545_c0_g1~~TRINITY_DN14545_c0_g1_i1.p1  ORF type:complete len:280 (+),score=65.53 TRINITY_DN14545_c0_g1_i1:43-882(+)